MRRDECLTGRRRSDESEGALVYDSAVKTLTMYSVSISECSKCDAAYAHVVHTCRDRHNVRGVLSRVLVETQGVQGGWWLFS